MSGFAITGDQPDARRDAVLLAAWADVGEREAAAWLGGLPVAAPASAALAAAAQALAVFLGSPEYDEILDAIRRFRRLPPLRRLEASDEVTRFDLRLREAYRRGVG